MPPESPVTSVELQPDPELISRIEKPVNEAWAEAEAIAMNPRLSQDARYDDINEKFQLSLAYVNAIFDTDVQSIDRRIAEKTVEARQVFSPPAEEASHLLITKEMVFAETSRMKSTGELVEFWNTALENKDLPTCRILLHFHHILKGRDAQRRSVELGASVPAKLIADTRELFISPAQRKARAQLEQLKVDRSAFERTRNKAIARLTKGFEIGKDGKLASKDTVLTHKVLA